MKNARVRLSAAALVAILSLAIASCGGIIGPPTPTQTPAQNTPQPSLDAVAGVGIYNNSDYSPCTFNTLGPVDDTNIQNARADLINELAGFGWSNTVNLSENSVNSGLVNQSLSDTILIYFGHGSPGLMVFNNHQIWGVGSTSGYFRCDDVPGGNPVIAFLGSNTQNMPITGNLHWVFSMSSDTIAGPPKTDSCSDGPYWTADWHLAFSTQGALHGLYGFWQHPLSLCNGQIADVTSGQVGPVAHEFAQLANNRSTPLSVFTSYVEAAEDANNGTSDKWAIWEDIANHKEALSTTGLSAPSGVIDFYDQELINGISTKSTMTADTPESPVTVQAQTFTLQPVNLVNEAIDDGSELSNIRNNADSNASYNDDGLVRTAYDVCCSVEHLYATTGAAFFHAEIKNNAVAFDEPTALQAAQEFLSTSLGLPSDAVLTETDNLWNIQPSSSGQVQIGYKFVWQHSSPEYGGDAVKVIVTDDYHVERTCTEYNENEPPHNIPICLAWSNTVVNQPFISYGYRLWRSASSNRSMLSTGQPAEGQQSIDAYTASLSLPSGFTVTGYTSGYWNGGPLDPNSTSAGLVPAWIFYDGDFALAVDAASGAVLGQP